MRSNHTHTVTNAFLADMIERDDRAIALKFPRKPLPNVRHVPFVSAPPFRYAGVLEWCWRMIGYAFVGALTIGTGWAIMAIITRVTR